MKLAFSEVESILAGMHQIASSHRSAFASRIKNYQRQGFPEGTQTGRGKAATYSVGHLLQLAFAIEFNQLGLLPDRAMKMVTGNVETIGAAIYNAIDFRGIKSEEVFIYFDPSNLNELMDDRYSDPASVSFWFDKVEAIKQRFDRWNAPSDMSRKLAVANRRLAFINVTQLIHSLMVQTEAVTEYEQKEITQTIALWQWRVIK